MDDAAGSDNRKTTISITLVNCLADHFTPPVLKNLLRLLLTTIITHIKTCMDTVYATSCQREPW